MNNKLKNKIFLLAIFIALFTMLISFQTYALFETNGIANKEMEIGNWNIKLNNNDISQTRTISLDDFIYVNGQHTESNYFAPGSTAYFDISIDTSLSDVSVEYQLDIDDTPIEDYPNITFNITNLDTAEVVNSNTYSGIIRLSDASHIVNIRITLVWSNISQYNESDTSLIGENLEFVIDANFSQYTGE